MALSEIPEKKMRHKITVYLLSLFAFFAAGAILAAFYIRTTTEEVDRLLILHQIEDLRQNLVMSVQRVQADLYTVRSAPGENLEPIIENVSTLDVRAEHCTSCHHEPALAKELQKMQLEVHEYQDALSQYITASADAGRIDDLKQDAAVIGSKILLTAEGMSIRAGDKLAKMTKSVMVKIKRAKTILYATIILSCILGIVIAVRLTMAVTRPVNELVKAARAIELGEVGYTISYSDKTELGELAGVFNRMSAALEDGYTKLHSEIIERKKTEEALRQSEERYALAARGANDGLWDWQLSQNKVYFSSRWKSMLGYESADLGTGPEEWFRLVHPDDRKHFEAKIATHLNGHTTHMECEYRMLHKDGAYRWVLNRGLAVRDINGKAYRMAGSQTDISERKMAEKQLFFDAFHDALTGLPNRALFTDRLQHRLRQAAKSKQRPTGYMFAVLFLDLDRFKIINDSLGHLVGDRLLVAVSRRLTESVRPGDTVARLGGDEFAILIEDVRDREHAEQVTERLQKELPAPFLIEGHEVFTTASIGIALSSQDYEKPEDMIRDADIAMYQAKARGKAHHAVFESGMYTTAVARLETETDLRRAVEHGDFVVHYQPIIELSTDGLIGFEALVRWNHPVRGLVYPADFIPLAEETGLIFQIGEWILNEACSQLRSWRSQYPMHAGLRMSLNISSRQFLQSDLVQKIGQALQKNALDASNLTIEITESMIMENIDSAVEALKQLQAMGVHIHIDDFGTGYSSLSYLQRFPVNALKIDRSFVDKMHIDKENLEIVKAIVSLAGNLKLDLIAEGLEKTDQLVRLRELNCAYGQGFLLSRPMDAAAAESWMQKKFQDMAS